MGKPLILASRSPFRQMLMRNAGLVFEAIAAEIDERAIENDRTEDALPPEEIALVLAEAKAREVGARFQDALVIGSDQTLSLGDCVFHKPFDLAEAKAHLQAMSGKTHVLNSAVVLFGGGQLLWRHVSKARLTMRPLSEAFIERHLERVGGRALASVGAYQLEGEGIQLFERIEGDYFTILGLPMLPLLRELREIGAIDA
ncbi:MAG: Maf-like protein [Shinella sp.]|nr:Maf-like protein [Shinella sp.]